MIRENRYVVFKMKDIEKYLNSDEIKTLNKIDTKIDTKIDIGRSKDNRKSLVSVLVESDWPEYEIVWKLIEDRVDKEQKQ